MNRLTILLLVFCVLAMVVYPSGKADVFQFLDEEAAVEMDTALFEVVTETMKPVCKLTYDTDQQSSHPVFKSIRRSGAAFSPDGRYFAITPCTNLGFETYLLDLKTGKTRKYFRASQTPVVPSLSTPVAFSSDSRRLTFMANNRIVVWDIPHGEEVCRIPLEIIRSEYAIDQNVYSLRFSEDGNKLMGVFWSVGTVWDIESQGAVLQSFGSQSFGSHDAPFDFFHCYPNLSHAMIFTSNKEKLLLRDLATNEDVERTFNYCFLTGYGIRNFLSKKVFSNDFHFFAHEISNPDNKGGSRLLVWDAATGNDICTIPLGYKLTAFTFLPGCNTLVTACDPNPEIEFVQARNLHIPDTSPKIDSHIPHATPDRKPVAQTETRAIIEFWDIDELIWHKEKVNLFPRKIKTCYLEGNDDILDMVASPDGKMLFMRSGNRVAGNTTAYGYIFSLDPDNPPDLPAEIQLNDQAIAMPENP